MVVQRRRRICPFSLRWRERFVFSIADGGEVSTAQLERIKWCGLPVRPDRARKVLLLQLLLLVLVVDARAGAADLNLRELFAVGARDDVENVGLQKHQRLLADRHQNGAGQPRKGGTGGRNESSARVSWRKWVR